MTFRDDCKVEASAYELSPQVWRAEVSTLRASNGEVLLAHTTVRELANIHRSAANAPEVTRMYAEAMIASGEFDCSPVLN